jgi:hypothetical protein
LPPLADANKTFEGPAVASGFGGTFNYSGFAIKTLENTSVRIILLQAVK